MYGSFAGIDVSVNRDLQSAESLLLDIYQDDKSVDYLLHCLCYMGEYDTFYPKTAIHWLHISANRTGSQSEHKRLAYSYREGDGIDTNPSLMVSIYF
ncbi:hypothetical protein N9383_02040 [Granulosicoccus sp.]|nr:hypothetical protein [Granulosicoccus sp.]